MSQRESFIFAQDSGVALTLRLVPSASMVPRGYELYARLQGARLQAECVECLLPSEVRELAGFFDAAAEAGARRLWEFKKTDDLVLQVEPFPQEPDSVLLRVQMESGGLDESDWVADGTILMSARDFSGIATEAAKAFRRAT